MVGTVVAEGADVEGKAMNENLPSGSEPTPPEGLSLESAARRILKTFEEDEAMGYRSRDRQFAIALLRKAFASSPAADRQEE